MPLIPPGTELTPRVNQLDLSVSKRITVGGIKIDPKLDIFNALNSDDYFTVRDHDVHAGHQPGAQRPALNGSGGTYLQPAAFSRAGSSASRGCDLVE